MIAMREERLVALRDAEPDRPLPVYSPQKVRDLLRLLPHMQDGSVPRDDPELREIMHVYGFRSWPKDAECEYHDLKRALAWLYTREPRAELAVRLTYAVGMSTREAAAALHVSNATAWRWCEDGVSLMAWYLGWREPPH